MKYILLIISLVALSACGDNTTETPADINAPNIDVSSFSLQNIRFDSSDYYDGEQVTVAEGKSFEVQWVSPSSASYKIDLYLSSNAQVYSENNKVLGLKCGLSSFSLCPNATGEVQCVIDDNRLSCSVDNELVGAKSFQEKDLATLRVMIKGCDALSNCDVKTFDLVVESNAK